MCHCKGDISKLTQKEMVLVHEGKNTTIYMRRGKIVGTKHLVLVVCTVDLTLAFI